MKLISCILINLLALAVNTSGSALKDFQLTGQTLSGTDSKNDYINLRIDEYLEVAGVNVLKNLTEADNLTIKYKVKNRSKDIVPKGNRGPEPLCEDNGGITQLLLASLELKETACPLAKQYFNIYGYRDFNVAIETNIDLPQAPFYIELELLKDDQQLITVRTRISGVKRVDPDRR